MNWVMIFIVINEMMYTHSINSAGSLDSPDKHPFAKKMDGKNNWQFAATVT